MWLKFGPESNFWMRISKIEVPKSEMLIRSSYDQKWSQKYPKMEPFQNKMKFGILPQKSMENSKIEVPKSEMFI